MRVARIVRSCAFALLALTFAHPVKAQGDRPSKPADAARPAGLDRNGVLILIRSTLLALHHANETGNYTVLRDLAAPGFREANTAARLAEIFAAQREQKLDLVGVSVLDPQLTLLPQIEANGLLRLAGFFPSVPSQVNFELMFAPVGGRWRVFGLAVNLGSSTPAAPMPSPTDNAKPTPRQEPKPEAKRSTNRPAKPVAKPASPTDTPQTSAAPAQP